MLDRPFAGFRRRTGGAYSMPEPRPEFFGKGSETKVQLPKWLSDYYESTAGREKNLQDYFWKNLGAGGNITTGTPARKPIKEGVFKPEYEPGYLPAKADVGAVGVTNPIDPTTGKILPGGLGGGQRSNADAYAAQEAALPWNKNLPPGVTGQTSWGQEMLPASSVRPPSKKIPQLPPGGITDGEPGDAATGFDIGQILGFRPEVTPGLSPYQQLVGKYIPELALDPNAETIAGQLALGGIGSAERTPGVTAEDPTIKALKDVYEGSTKELLKNEATMGGYNRSSAMTDVLAKNWMAQLAPALEAQMGRGERAIERGQRARETAIGQQTGAAAARTGRLAQALGFGVEQGALERGVEKEKAAADQAEKLRLAALGEQSVMGPMGLLPSSIGSRTGKAK